MNVHQELLYERLRFAVKYFRNTLRVESVMRTKDEETKNHAHKIQNAKIPNAITSS